MKRFWLLVLVLCLGVARAESLLGNTPSSAAELVRSGLASAQTELMFDPESARNLVLTAQIAYQNGLSALGNADFAALKQAVEAADQRGFAVAYAKLWTGVLRGAYQQLETAITRGDLERAKAWLLVREYRRASRFVHPETEATLALESGNTTQDRLLAVRSDVLGTYQARLSEALFLLEQNLDKNFAVLSAQHAALAQGYFLLLAAHNPPAKSPQASQALTKLVAQSNRANLLAVRQALHGWRAAPLSVRERDQRAVQALRFLALVPVEYARGVKTQDGKTVVSKDLEISEATVFWQGANAAFADLESLLPAQPSALGRQALAEVGTHLQAAAQHNPVPLASLEQSVQNASRLLEGLIPQAWRTSTSAADLDIIKQHLGQLETAMQQGAFAEAETARVSAYAVLESGVEARIKFFEPQLASDIEQLFWNGTGGLAKLIAERASPAQFTETRRELLGKLETAMQVVGTNASPEAAFVNALVIVFREGLEAVLILAALLGSLKRPEVRHLRRPLWLGAVAALAASAVTFLIMRGIVNAFAVLGERLEAVVSAIAIAVLLVIMNWFFHNIYWNERLANFHKQKHSLLGIAAGQGLGLALLGFTAMYREGFETALFLQSLVLQSGLSSVLLGTGVALLGVGLIGVLVFALQAKLPHKKMLVLTGVLICAVLWVMVGNTVHIWQVVGWLPIHSLGYSFPAGLGLWLGTFATWEGLILQTVAVGAVIGSYFLAEGLKQRSLEQKAAAV